MHQALFYKKLSDQKVQCRLCHHFCLIASTKKGICQTRQNIGGVLYSLNYGKLIAQHLDPIEKKPLYRFLPRTFTYSIASAGCNFKCWHCQNADISQISDNLMKINQSLIETTAEEVVMATIANNCPSISYTYTEPTVFAEFALECMRLAKEKKLKNIWVSNGYMSDDCLESVLPYLDATNVDLKFFDNKKYLKICGAKLQPVLDNLIKIKSAGIHLEVTTLIIPSLNDSEEELKAIAEFIFQKLGVNTAWHVSAFYPAYKMKELMPTSKEIIFRAKKIGEKIGLKFVYAGNI